jgi:hypothetical protein
MMSTWLLCIANWASYVTHAHTPTHPYTHTQTHTHTHTHIYIGGYSGNEKPTSQRLEHIRVCVCTWCVGVCARELHTMQKLQKRRLRDGTSSIKDNNVSYRQRLRLPCVRNTVGALKFFFEKKGKRPLEVLGLPKDQCEGGM